MNNLEITANTDLNIVDYVGMIDAIASEFFDADGEYTPHIGVLNAMRLFYNECVTESKFDIPHDITDVLDMEPLVADGGFISVFNEVIKGDAYERLDFANAYRHALDIVNTKKSSIGSVVDVLKNAINNVIKQIEPVISEENIQRVSQIAKAISEGDINAEAIVKAYNKINNPK